MSVKQSISRTEAYQIWEKYLQTPYLKLHTLESEAIMRKLAHELGEDVDFWGNTALLHDLDMDLINGQYGEHGTRTVAVLKEEGFDIPVMFHAIQAHCEGIAESGVKRESKFDFILAGAENLTGIISAYVAIKPDKKIVGTKASSVNKKLKSPAFAASVNRQFIQEAIEASGLEQAKFIELAIEAFEEIADKIGM
jgi:putative nucleotidyltransferase with HDIG domain